MLFIRSFVQEENVARRYNVNISGPVEIDTRSDIVGGRENRTVEALAIYTITFFTRSLVTLVCAIFPHVAVCVYIIGIHA